MKEFIETAGYLALGIRMALGDMCRSPEEDRSLIAIGAIINALMEQLERAAEALERGTKGEPA
jgi:hypothetical protein